MKKALKYIAGILILLVLAYNSVYFRKLDEVKASSSGFNAKAYAEKYFRNKLLPSLNGAIELEPLLALLQTNKDEAFEKYSHALGIGNIRYFLVRGEGEVVAVNENDVLLQSKTDSSHYTFHIATEFVFGNAIRDASGQIDINEFKNTMDFNNVSAEINEIVRAEVLPPFKKNIKKGDTVQFAGAIELNREHLNISDIEVIPVQLKILHP
jgi:predicted lipoprotein